MTISIGREVGTFERTRRTRRSAALRGLVRETRLDPAMVGLDQLHELGAGPVVAHQADEHDRRDHAVSLGALCD